MKTAVVGYGVIGKLHAGILRERGTLSAICDIDRDVLSDITDVELYSDYITMLDTHRPDAVHICTPHYLHAEMVIEALRRNINVLCEKPLCIREEDIPRILEAEKSSEAILGVCHQNRYNPSNLYIKEYLKDKTLKGGIGSVCWIRDAEYYASGAWRGKWDTEGGGVLINQALHTLDLMQWFCGMPEKLAASVSNLTLKEHIEVEDTAAISAKGVCDFNFYATNGGVGGLPVEITLRTDTEVIKVMPRYTVIGNEFKEFPKGKRTGAKVCYGSGHELLIDDFYSCIKAGRHFPIDGEEGAKVIRLILAAYKSRGEWIEI